MKYLIIECSPLGDQWECDANRIPVCTFDTDEQLKDYILSVPTYSFEVWRWNQKNNNFTCLNDWELLDYKSGKWTKSAWEQLKEDFPFLE